MTSVAPGWMVRGQSQTLDLHPVDERDRHASEPTKCGFFYGHTVSQGLL